MTAQELLHDSLSKLLILQQSSFNLSFDSAIDLSSAIDRINDILTALEEEGKDWDASSFSHFLKTKDERMQGMKDKLAELEEFSGADLAVADTIVEACRQ
jgi:hypothetical protein